MTTIHGFVLMSAAMVAGCAAPGSDPAPASPKDAAPGAAGTETNMAASPRGMTTVPVEVRYVPEMEPWPDEFGSGPAASLSDQERFHAAWARVAPAVETKVSAAALSDASRWAIEQTRAATLPPGWASQLPMEPVAVTPDDKQVLFAQDAQRSPVKLPSHAPVVFRRVVAGAVFDRASGGIPVVYVTIRGWAEE